MIARIAAKDAVDEIDDVGSNHGDFIDDDEFHFPNELAMLSVVLEELVKLAPCIARVVGHKGMKRKFEEAMEGDTSCIDGSNTSGCQHHVFLLGMLTDVFQECRFACPRLSCEEKGIGSELNKIQRIPKLRVLGIYFYLHAK